MAIPRKEQIDPEIPGYYHLISRCVQSIPDTHFTVNFLHIQSLIAQVFYPVFLI